MKSDIISVNNFTVLLEQYSQPNPIVEKCDMTDEMIGFVFYGSGNVELDINYGRNKKTLLNHSGSVTSFFGNHDVEFVHKISNKKPLQSISIFSSIENLRTLMDEREISSINLSNLFNPQADFVSGPSFHMTPDMQNAVHKIFNIPYSGATKKMFLESQVTELISHFFGFVLNMDQNISSLNSKDIDKLHLAKSIIKNNLEQPPSLNELAKLSGLNINKLKKGFKILFGMPVYKYLQNERLTKAYDLLMKKEMNIQEVAWFVGYESLSSFSNAFLQKFNTRPSKI